MTLHQQHGTKNTEISSSYLLVHALCWFSAWVSDYINNKEYRTQRYPDHTSWYMLCAGLLYLLALVCAWVYDNTSRTWNTEHKRYTVNTSWYMLCAGLLYLLGLACAWEYDYTSTTWNTEIPSTYLLVHALCWFIVFTSTSLCLGVWLHQQHGTQNTEIPSSYLLVHALCWII